MPTFKKGFYHPISILILAIITLTVALAIFANSGFFANKNVPTPPSPTPQPPPKSSPKISSVDQTINWKILITRTKESDGSVFDGTSTINFSFKYPPAFNSFGDEGTEVITNDSKWEFGLKTEGTLEVFARIASSEEKPAKTTKSSLGGKEALRGVTNNGSRITVIYFIDSIMTKEGVGVPFAYFCNYKPKIGIDSEKTCDLMASTFKFLN